jgi:hypothetical protein
MLNFFIFIAMAAFAQIAFITIMNYIRLSPNLQIIPRRPEGLFNAGRQAPFRPRG